MFQNQNPYAQQTPALANLGNPIELSQGVIAPGVQAGMGTGHQPAFAQNNTPFQQQTLYQLLGSMQQPNAAANAQRFASGGVIALEGGGKIATGPGGGLDDLIPTTIDGQRAASLSDGEFVIPADVVSMMGDGSSNAGSQRLYDLVKQIREAKTGTGEQAEPLEFKNILQRISG